MAKKEVVGYDSDAPGRIFLRWPLRQNLPLRSSVCSISPSYLTYTTFSFNFCITIGEINEKRSNRSCSQQNCGEDDQSWFGGEPVRRCCLTPHRLLEFNVVW
ncbi:uncharacterized protein LOC127248886 [Andrographis paniculata]|uniref:uncharacterized protein LOC127248886 n=1 Tax=Andrographis paniculata TaxID=175694 RepID=UPI0021E90E30|nr:uncharacterized protein LOC127248886 [Andrographis paniculata]